MKVGRFFGEYGSCFVTCVVSQGPALCQKDLSALEASQRVLVTGNLRSEFATSDQRRAN